MCLGVGSYGMGLGYYVLGSGSGELRQEWVRETIMYEYMGQYGMGLERCGIGIRLGQL